MGFFKACYELALHSHTQFIVIELLLPLAMVKADHTAITIPLKCIEELLAKLEKTLKDDD